MRTRAAVAVAAGRYIRDGHCHASYASITLSKWLKRAFGGLTAHCLRHTMRDRLRAVECPMDMIDQIGGWEVSHWYWS